MLGKHFDDKKCILSVRFNTNTHKNGVLHSVIK